MVVRAQSTERQHGIEVQQESTDTIMEDQRMIGGGVGCDIALEWRSPDDELRLPRI